MKARILVFLYSIFLASLVQADEWILGLDADMSTVAAEGGKSIYEGAQIAVDEINEKGGVAGKPLNIIVKDHRGNPARGVDNFKAFNEMENLIAVMGGVHTPVAMNELKTVHELQIPFLVPWAAGTPIIDNGYDPNYVFRVSVRDQLAGPFLMKEVSKRGAKKVALFLERTGWGRSNQKSMQSAADELGIEVVDIQWFNWGVKDLTKNLLAASDKGAEAILLVANAPEGAVFAKNMSELPKDQQKPVYSHWGISGGAFVDKVGLNRLLSLDLSVLQTYSFINAKNSKSRDRVFSALKTKFRNNISTLSVRAPVGIAHAYDLVHILSKAIEQASLTGGVTRQSVRDALENLSSYDGLVKRYEPPFTKERHEGLGIEDFQLGKYNDQGFIVPVR